MQLLDRPIAFQPSFVGLGAGVTGAVLLSQLVYWQNRMDGWFYKTQAELTTETGLSRYEQEGARKKLVTAGVLEEDRRGVPAKLYFRVNKNRLEALLIQYAEIPHSRMRQTSRQECGNSADKSAENPRARSGKSRIHSYRRLHREYFRDYYREKTCTSAGSTSRPTSRLSENRLQGHA
ncbi:hypothetical protein [Serratia liquefaciens]|uniref:hypothetical protein n=1 Tax=Serratia liquefaciens TaxID=614 RepID=UPI0018CC707A|nr:hypothetical protein [Serratia liquefaciens]